MSFKIVCNIHVKYQALLYLKNTKKQKAFCLSLYFRENKILHFKWNRFHYENKPIQIYWTFYHKKNEHFRIKKNSDIFHISAQNIDCGYSLEPPRRGGSNEYPQSMFLSRNKKNNVYPDKP